MTNSQDSRNRVAGSFIAFAILICHVLITLPRCAAQSDAAGANATDLGIEAAALHAQAIGQIQMDKHSDAHKTLNEAIQKFPKAARLYETRGAVRCVLGDRANALADMSKAIELGLDTAFVYRNRANVYMALGDYTHAVRDLDTAIDKQPTLSEFRIARMYSNYQLGRFSALSLDANACLSQDSRNVEALVYRGLAKQDQGDLDGALADYDMACAISPKFEPAVYNRGWAYMKKRDYGKALKDYSTAIALNPANARSYFFRGRALVRLGRVTAALGDMGEAIRREPAEPGMRLEIAAVLCQRTNRYHEAYFHADQAVNLAPTQGAVYRTRGTTLWHLGEMDRAVEDYMKAVRLDPSDTVAIGQFSAALLVRHLTWLIQRTAVPDTALKRP
jgi:tetratricopeptide (TPR) repeat protein